MEPGGIAAEEDSLVLQLWEPEAIPLPAPDRVPKMTADQVVDALEGRYPLKEWAFIRELQDTVGGANRRLDAWAIHFWSPNELCAFEVKISRADFKHELEQPDKRAFGLSVSSHFYFAVPAKMVQPEEVPPECGLIWVYEDGRTSARKAAPCRTRDGWGGSVDRPSWGFVASTLRHQRREDYRQGPGHKGQCRGGGGYYTKEKKVAAADYGGYEYVDAVWHAGDPDTFCGKEAGHMGYCDRLPLPERTAGPET